MTTTTRLVAFGPSAEVGKKAVNFTRVCVARNLGRQGGTCSATEVSGDGDGAPFSGTASVAHLGADTVAAILSYDAIDGTAPEVALSTAFEGRAGNATMGGIDNDGARVQLHSTAARLVTVTPLTPLRDDAVDGTGLGVANILLVQIRAG
jgi:hypothetical protein